MVTETKTEDFKLLRETPEEKMQRRLKAKGWGDNTVSRYLVLSGLTPSDMANTMGVNRCVVNRWVYLKNEELTPFCRWVFLAFTKLKGMGVSVEDCF